ncbi:MAG TPA: HAMP domain-containing sensor histidine kinase [Candidatus Binataceae bacterium]|nr:HAMP domain-containing sensor histidine kinase [Candidatus Binataceae bacterium]
MKVGTRLTLMMLAFLGPVGLVYTFVTLRSTTLIFAEDLRAEAKIAQRALNASLTPDVQQGEWDEVHYIMAAIGSDDLVAALLDKSGRIRFALRGFPIEPPSLEWISRRIKSTGAAEFMRRAGGRTWYCRIVALGPGASGYLMVAQDWTALSKDRDRRIVAALIAIAGVLLIVVTVIPLVARRYVSRPLADLRRRVMNLDGADGSQPRPGGDEMTLISEEFQRVDDELASARRRLLEESERKLQLERRLRHADKLATIGTLASGFAHEIGTPLGVIRGRAELLLSGYPNERKLAEALSTIIAQIDRITKMVRMLLDLGRRREILRAATDVRTIAVRTIELLETEAARRGIAVVAELGAEALVVDCDPDQLQQVFVNLEMNALDAMAGGSGTLRVSASAADSAGGVRICFEDSGPGVPTAIKDRIFDPFFTTKAPGKGTGMGLAVSQSIVADHEGELSLEPNSRGARFVVTLPAAAPPRVLARSA